ncbi:hypothetical protein [Treponema maltophilum]|uniref:hypothetical protein n=1 Tax=Treponema maltophilum TaxID=51160 RepID=UPI003D8B685B
MSCAALFCSVLLISCGLETFYKIEPPDNADLKNPADGTTLSVTTTAETRKYEFSSKSNGGFIAAGTEVYYRIYNSVEKLQQDARSINAVNTDIGGNGFAGMERLGYKKLHVHFGSKKNQDLLIKDVHRVVIRLADDGTLVGGVFYDGAGSPQFSPVLRESGTQFYFKTDNQDLKPPLSGDTDVDSDEDSGALAGKYWYVNAYAVSVGLVSATWTRSVSKLLPLGFLAFEKNRS